MAVLTAFVQPASKLKQILSSMDTINEQFARLTICSNGLFVELNIQDPNHNNKPLKARLDLLSDWFLIFHYISDNLDDDHDNVQYGWPLIFDFSHFCQQIRLASDTDVITLYVNSSNEQMAFQLRFYNDALVHQYQRNMKFVPFHIVDIAVILWRVFENIYCMNGVTVIMHSNPFIHVLQHSIRNGQPMYVILRHRTVTLVTKWTLRRLRRGELCRMKNFDNPQGRITLCLSLHRAPYLLEAASVSRTLVLRVISSAWAPLSSVILRVWFALNAFLDFEFSQNCIVQRRVLDYIF